MKAEVTPRSLAYFRSLPYTRLARVEYDGRGKPCWVAYIKEIPACRTAGSETFPEAMRELNDVLASHVRTCLTLGHTIPEPGRAAG